MLSWLNVQKTVRIAVLGSTGSIGRQTLAVAREQRDKVQVVALAARSNEELLTEQIRDFQPAMACLTSRPNWEDVSPAKCFGGDRALVDFATHPDVDLVVLATSGHDGFRPLLAALQAGKAVALANKEALVMAGELVRQAADKAGVQLRPIDSEHSALWQCLQGESPSSVKQLILTATGGPFRDWSQEQLQHATPAQALKHPVWRMGKKITIDSATLMNKGLEVIEAHWLFNMPYEHIDVVIHPQGLVHSLVRFRDGALKAQLGTPDMRTAIRYALSWPARWESSLEDADLLKGGPLYFFPPDTERFPCLAFARWAGKDGGTYPTALCAVDEVAVQAFSAGIISWNGISQLIQTVLDRHKSIAHPSIDDVLAADEETRRVAHVLLTHNGIMRN